MLSLGCFGSIVALLAFTLSDRALWTKNPFPPSVRRSWHKALWSPPRFLSDASQPCPQTHRPALSTIAFREKKDFQEVCIQQQKLWERWERSEHREPFSKRCVKRGKTAERGSQLPPCRFFPALHSAAVSTVWLVGLGVRPPENWLSFGKQLSWSRGMRCGLLCQSARSDST